METLSEQFSKRLEAYLQASGMFPTTFGNLAVKDGGFVFRVRKGHAITMKKADLAVAYMISNPVEGMET